MNVTILCSDKAHPIYPRLIDWAARWGEHTVVLKDRVADLTGGDILFLISCHEIVRRPVRDLYRHTLVIHASDLPSDRGWSPHIWAVLRGDPALTVTLLEAGDGVDTGRIYMKIRVPLTGTEVAEEINAALFSAELDLMDWAMTEVDLVAPQPQEDREATYLRRRTPEDSRIDPHLSIAEQFDLLRVVDPDRYPAFFDFRGRRYTIKVSPVDPAPAENE